MGSELGLRHSNAHLYRSSRLLNAPLRRLNDRIIVKTPFHFEENAAKMLSDMKLGPLLRLLCVAGALACGLTVPIAYGQSAVCNSNDAQVRFADGSDGCIKEFGFFNRPGVVSGQPDETYTSLANRYPKAYAITLNANPQMCPFAQAIGWNLSGSEAARALPVCEDRLRQAVQTLGKAAGTQSCRCEVLVDSGRSALTRSELLARTRLYERQSALGNRAIEVAEAAEAQAMRVAKAKLDEEARKAEEIRLSAQKMPAAGPSAYTRKVALVIGNAAYAGEWRLKNPINDALAMANKLREIGFTVIYYQDLKALQIGDVMAEVSSQVTPGSAFVFYYAGHGVQIKGENFFPAVDANIKSQFDVPTQSLQLQRVLDMTSDAKASLNLMMLDACRNNPWLIASRSVTGGLSKIDPPTGTLISFATRPGSVADDGVEGANGLYTRYLLKHIDTPNLPVESFFKRVSNDVHGASKGKQEPWVEGNIRGEFTFKDR